MMGREESKVKESVVRKEGAVSDSSAIYACHNWYVMGSIQPNGGHWQMCAEELNLLNAEQPLPPPLVHFHLALLLFFSDVTLD